MFFTEGVESVNVVGASMILCFALSEDISFPQAVVDNRTSSLCCGSGISPSMMMVLLVPGSRCWENVPHFPWWLGLGLTDVVAWFTMLSTLQAFYAVQPSFCLEILSLLFEFLFFGRL